MNYENTKWINQPLYSFKDKQFNSNSTLDLTLTMHTNDSINFSMPKLSAQIKSDISNQKYTYQFSIQDIIDLIESIKLPISNLQSSYQNKIQIEKAYQKDKAFTISFRKSQIGQECIIIMISYSESDNLYIIMAIEQFLFLNELFLKFKEDYISIALNFPNRLINPELSERLKNIETALKILPTQIVIPEISVCNETSKSENIQNLDISNEVDEFQKFALENIDKIEIPLLNQIENEDKKTKSTEHEINSILIEKCLNNDIQNYANLISNLYHSNDSPYVLIKEKLQEFYHSELLPGLNDNDLKSLTYISSLRFKLLFIDYLEHNVAMPISGIQILKYKANDINSEHICLAYDLSLINMYIKITRQKLEMKESDSISNQASLHIASRLFTDAFYTSIISDINDDIFKSCILTRFKKYNESGFFDYFKNILKQYNCSDVNEFEMIDAINEFKEMINNSVLIEKYHNAIYNNGFFKIPYINSFTLEQITKEIIDIESKVICGKSIQNINMSPEISELFLDKSEIETNKEIKPKKEVKYKNNLHRFVSSVDYVNEIPNHFKDEFIDYIANLENSNIDFNTHILPLDELGENIIKAIYIWNENDKDIRYTIFITNVEECILTKDLILSILKRTVESPIETADDWSFDI